MTTRIGGGIPFSLGDTLSVRIEVPRGGRIKRSAAGRIEFVSPLACPYNYGSVVSEERAADGEPFDALVLGPRESRGSVATGALLGVVDFLDRGEADPKLVIGESLGPDDRASISAFFHRYAQIKRVFRLTRQTRFRGWF